TRPARPTARRATRCASRSTRNRTRPGPAASSGCSTPVGSSLASTAASRISARSALNNAGRRGGGRALEPPAQDPCLTDREKPAVSAAAARQTRSAARRRVLPASGCRRDRIDAQSLPVGWSAMSRGDPLHAALLYRQSSPRPPLSNMETECRRARGAPGAVDLSGPESPSRGLLALSTKSAKIFLEPPKSHPILRVCGRPCGGPHVVNRHPALGRVPQPMLLTGGYGHGSF